MKRAPDTTAYNSNHATRIEILPTQTERAARGMNDGRQTLRRGDIRSPTTIKNTRRSGHPHTVEGARDPEDFLSAPLS